jgi:serine/threonine-protein kinase
MYRDRTAPELVAQLLGGSIPPPSQFAPNVPPALDNVVLCALARHPEQRYESALSMAAALESGVRPASVEATAQWVSALASESLQARALLVIEAESETTPSQRHPRSPIAPLDPTVLASSAAEQASRERDDKPARPSNLARLLGTTAFKLFAMAAGVSIVWFAGGKLLPRPAPEARRDARTGDAQGATFARVAPAVQRQPAPPADAGSAAAWDRVTSNAAAEPTAKLPTRASDSSIPNTRGAGLPPGVRRAPTRLPRSAAAEAPAADCSPPFSLDKEGIRHMKPGCR